jgi:hypothetical protein
MASIPLPALSVQGPTNALEEYARVAQIGSQIQNQKAQALEIQQRQQQNQDLQATTEAMKNWDPKSQSYDDLSKDILARGGSANAATQMQLHGIQVQKQALDLTDAQRKSLKENNEYLGNDMEQYADPKTVPDDQLHQTALNHVVQLVNEGRLGKDEAQQLVQGIQNAPDAQTLRTGIDNWAKHKLGMAAVLSQEKMKAETEEAQQKTATGKAQESQAEAETALKQGESAYYDAHGGGGPGITPERMEMDSWLAANPKKTPADFLKYKSTLVPAFNFNLANNAGQGTNKTPAQIAQSFGLTQAAFDAQAEKYNTTGVLPPLGRGNPNAAALNKAIMNRAAELHPGESLAENSAEYKANAASLSKIQTNFDQVSAFENTAQKNLDLFIDKLSKIPDLGVKFADVPMRMIDDKLIGSKGYQEMKAAQQTAATETAKVLGSANASGVLSDSQKKEAEDILSGNLSLNAAKGVVATLKQDFANRHQSYQDQIDDIKRRGVRGQSKSIPVSTFTGAPKTAEDFIKKHLNSSGQ